MKLFMNMIMKSIIWKASIDIVTSSTRDKNDAAVVMQINLTELRGSSRRKWSKLSNFCFLLKKSLQVWGHCVPNF